LTEPTTLIPKSRFSILLYLGIAFLAFTPCLLFGKIYFANDLLYSFSHFHFFQRAQLAAGHFPLWNPYLLGGQPYFADLTNTMCYPLHYFCLLFPVTYGFGVFFFLHMFIAAWGMHRWLKALRVSEGACRLGALTFALSSCFWWELIHPTILSTFAWFPWWMASLEKLGQEFSTRRAFLCGLTFALLFTCGNFQLTACFLYLGVLYLLFRLIQTPTDGQPRAFAWKKVLPVLLFGLWGGLPLLSQLIPTAELSKYSDRRSREQSYEAFNGQFSMRPASTYEFFFPSLGVARGDTLENAIQGVTDNQNYDNAFLGAFGYLGIWTPFLALLAFLRKDRRLLYFLLALGVLSILTAWGRYFPLHKLLCEILPSFNLSRAPFRFIYAYVGCACVLAAYGYQALEKAILEKAKITNLILVGGIYAFFLTIVGFFNPGETWRELLALIFGIAGLYLWALTESWQKMGKWLFIGALVVPLFLSGWGSFSWGPPSNFNFEQNFPLPAEVKTAPRGSRFLFHESLTYPLERDGKYYLVPLPEDIALTLGLKSSGGYITLSLQRAWDIRALPFPTFQQLTALRGILMGKEAQIEGFTHRQAVNYHYYESEKPPAFITAPFQWRVIPNDKERLAAMSAPTFNPAEQVLFQTELPASVLSQLPGKKAALSYEWVTEELNRESFKVRLDKNSLVHFSEVMFPGWKAKVDGKPAELFTGNHLFRVLFLPAGEHLVEFSFEPSWVKPILLGLLLWLVSALLYAAWLLKLRAIVPHSSSEPSATSLSKPEGRSGKPDA
jgi:hypothetical protein